MNTRSFALVVIVSLLALSPEAALAQGKVELKQGEVEIKAPPPAPPPRPEFIAPEGPPDVTRPREQDFYPDEIRVRHDPAFIVPLSTTVRTGPRTALRFGLSAWTAPQGRGNFLMAREEGGWLSLGFSLVWDVPAGAEPSPTTPR